MGNPMAHTHDFIPLPAQALPEDDGPDGYRLQKAGENGYVVISGFVQSVFGVTADCRRRRRRPAGNR
jgi:hypothetical protein